ncbi:hypothetical protein Salat_1865200 [Sesamum alatum]|uniref:Uncharacterized protein n=1 Tax=Sesamum alatum TaxID=300844 RepID=A0AAE1Y3H9_9LAMI|nr:hypothetical protein Salat_1865200 [Sesamum alatum]
MNAIPHFDAIAEDEACWEAEQEQNQKRKFSSSGGEGSSAASMQPKKSSQIGLINLFFRKEPTEVTQQRRGKEAYSIDEAKKKLRENAIQKFARWMYDAGLPFNAVNYDSLGPAIEAFGQYGTGMKPPSYYEIRAYDRAVMINGYIYNRGPLLHMLREFIADRDMVRPAKTRFATAFLTLKRFHVEKVNLRKMFTSEMWSNSKYAKGAQGKLVASIILMPSFWKHVAYALKAKKHKSSEALRRRYDARDTIDPIALNEIDECNEWMLGSTLNSDDDEENARVFEDDDLTWGDAARAAGVDEDAYAFRPRSSKNITSKASSSKGSSLKAFKATKKASTSSWTSSKSTKNPLRLVDEEEEEVNFDDTDEEDLNCYISSSDREDKNDDNDEDVELGDELESD